MRWLKGNEEGAVSIVVAVMLIVLFGLGALVVDVGNLYWERRELQRGADAAAMAAAQELVGGGSEAGALAEARYYANENNTRGAYVRPSEFETTSTSVSVTARTGTEAAEGTLNSILAGVLGVDRYATQARASVEWSASVGGGRTIPIAICDRAWYDWTDLKGLPTGPPEHMVSFDGAAQNAAPYEVCGNPSYDTYPGGFGFLRRDSDCYISTRLDESTNYHWVPGNVGSNLQDNSSHPDCRTAQQVIDKVLVPEVNRSIANSDHTVLVPIFDAYDKSTNEFRLLGYGAFRLTGYHMNSGVGTPSTYMMTAKECNDASGPPNNASCLKGYFTDFVAVGDADMGGPAVPSFGTSVIRFVE